MDGRTLRSNLILLLTALIWGFAFVAQRVGMDFIGPMYFNGIRFVLGALSLLPLLLLDRRRGRGGRPASEAESGGSSDETGAASSETDMPGSGADGIPERKTGGAGLWFVATGAGLVLFAGASLQQIGIVYTSAGNAGFITGLYIIIVPISGMLWGQRTPRAAWFGAVMALTGLYFLSVKSGFHIGKGDLLVLASALFWALHVHIIGHAAPRYSSVRLSIIQYVICAVLSLLTALFTESIGAEALIPALPAIVYGGVMSVGVAYTLQIIGQRHAHPSHAAIILSLEGAFAALGGWLLLRESLSPRELAGALLMLGGMLVSQIPGRKKRAGNGSATAV